MGIDGKETIEFPPIPVGMHFEPHLPKLETLPSQQTGDSPTCNPRGKVLRAAKVHN